MSKAIFYLTYNGIYNFTNGIGTQTQLLLNGLERIREPLQAEFGPVDLHVLCPRPESSSWGYDAAFFARQRERIVALGGALHEVPFKTRPGQELWDVQTWQTLCHHAARLLLPKLAAYDRCLLIAVDPPWIQTPRYMARAAPYPMPQVSTLLALYNTAVVRSFDTVSLHDTRAPDAAEMAWERGGLRLAHPDREVYVGDICPSFTRHLQAYADLPRSRFAPYTSSILVDDEAFRLQPASEVSAILQQHGVPLDSDIVLAFGRARPLKGFEDFIPALAAVREHCHFVLVSVPYPGDAAQQNLYDALLARHAIQATHVRHFSRQLPRALCQWPRTKMVVIPSRQETFSNIYLEAALWARQQGPVVVAAEVGGFVDQIQSGDTGFLIDTSSCDNMQQVLRHVLGLPQTTHAAIRRNAYQDVMRRYDFRHNFPATLRWFWGRADDQQRSRVTLGANA